MYRAQVIKLWVRSLAFGTKHIYQTLPRTLTIWLEMGERPTLVEYFKNRRTKYVEPGTLVERGR